MFSLTEREHRSTAKAMTKESVCMVAEPGSATKCFILSAKILFKFWGQNQNTNFGVFFLIFMYFCLERYLHRSKLNRSSSCTCFLSWLSNFRLNFEFCMCAVL